MAAPSEGGRSTCEGVQDELGDVLMSTVNIISSFFEMLDLDKNGNVELADLQRMQVAHYLCSQPFLYGPGIGHQVYQWRLDVSAPDKFDMVALC